MTSVRLAPVAFGLTSLLACAAVATAEDISGVLNVTKVIIENSQLVGDVTCTMTTTPCIQFGAANITLRLNGHIITGPAPPRASHEYKLSAPAWSRGSGGMAF